MIKELRNCYLYSEAFLILNLSLYNFFYRSGVYSFLQKALSVTPLYTYIHVTILH